jgi:MFS family permease
MLGVVAVFRAGAITAASMYVLDQLLVSALPFFLICASVGSLASIIFFGARVLRIELARGAFFITLSTAALFLVAAIVAFGVGMTLISWSVFFLVYGMLEATGLALQSSILQKLVSPEELPKVLSIEQVAINVGRTAGPLLAVVPLSFLGAPRAFIALSLILVFALIFQAIVFRTLKPHVDHVAAMTTPIPNSVQTIRSWMTQAMAGLKLRWDISTEKFLSAQTALELFIVVPAFGVMLTFAADRVNWGTSGVGYLVSACGFGLLLGGLAATSKTIERHQWQLVLATGYGMVAALLSTAFAIGMPNIYLACASLFAANFLLSLRIYCGRAQRRLAIPRDVVASYVTAHIAINSISAKLGLAFGALLMTSMGPIQIYVFYALLLLIVVLPSPFIPRWRDLITSSPAQAKSFYENPRH